MNSKYVRTGGNNWLRGDTVTAVYMMPFDGEWYAYAVCGGETCGGATYEIFHHPDRDKVAMYVENILDLFADEVT